VGRLAEYMGEAGLTCNVRQISALRTVFSAIGLAIVALVVASIYGDWRWGLMFGAFVLVGALLPPWKLGKSAAPRTSAATPAPRSTS